MALKHSADGIVTSPASLLWARRDSELAEIIEDGPPAKTWTWAQLAGGASEVASRLGSLGGDWVTVTAPNGGALVSAIFGVWLAGGVPVPISPKLPAGERSRVLESITAERHIVAAGLGLDGQLQLDDSVLSAAVRDEPRPPKVALADPGIVLCTSGTTGRPKAIVHPMRAVWGQIDSVTRHLVDPDDLPAPTSKPPSRIETKPMVHIGSIFGLLFSLWRGRSFVIMQRFEPVRYAELVRQHSIDTLSLVPSMIRMMLDSQADVGRLAPPAKVVSSGTAALPARWRQEFEQRFGVPVQTTYGQTEAGTIAYEPMEDVLSGNRRAGTSGRIIGQLEVEIRDEDRKPLPVGEQGRIWIRGEAVRPSLLGDDASRLVDGWLDTGDLGKVDADRYIYLTGRTRELIIRGGFNVIPAEVENVLMEHANVAEAVVAGRADPRLGEVPVAWVRTAGHPLDADELVQFARDRLAHYKVPVAVHEVSEFPRNDTGKIRKRDLRPTDAASA